MMPTLLDEIYDLILERNSEECTPFISLDASNSELQNIVDKIQKKCNDLEAADVENKSSIQQLIEESKGKGPSKIETKQRERIEKLQEKLNEKLRSEVQLSEAALDTEKELSKQKETNLEYKEQLSNLQAEILHKETVASRLFEELDDLKSNTKLQENQYLGLKDTVRSLQVENDMLKETNAHLVNRLVTEKEGLVDEMNKMNGIIENLNKEIEMLKSYKKNDSKRRFFNKGDLSKDLDIIANETTPQLRGRMFGEKGIILPSAAKLVIQAHPSEISSVRYDDSGSDLVATAGDSMVKIWDTGNGLSNTSLRGSSSHVFMGVDFSGGTVTGSSTDKTCRIWNTRTKRMIHQLVGHQHKVTCVRLFNKENHVITGSADRSLKVWDISKNTYRQTITLRHGSTANSIDVSTGSTMAVSGHFDGGLRCWDMKSSERIFDLHSMHVGGVTSVQINPSNEIQLLTMGRDSLLKLVDMRTFETIYTFHNEEFRVSQNHASCAISPDGKYTIAGSGTNGHLFLWNLADGKLEKKLKAHDTGVVSVAWGRGGTNGQQIASVDDSGKLILWA